MAVAAPRPPLRVRKPVIRTWRSKLLILLMAFAIVPLIVQALADYLGMRRAFTLATLESLQGLARAKGQAIDQFVLDRRTQVERIAGLLVPRIAAVERARQLVATPPLDTLPALQDAEALPVSGPPAAEATTQSPPAQAQQRTPEPLRMLRENLALILWDQRQFEELLVIDRQGRVIASTHEGHEGTNAETLEYFRQGLGATFVQPVFLSPVTGKLTMVVATPIRDPQAGVLGVLAARLNLTRFFEVTGDPAGLGESGESVVARRAEDRIVLMAPTRSDPDAALKRSVGAQDELAKGLQLATQGQSGAGRIRDYRGTDVLAAWQPVPSLGWGLVVKIDRREALAPAVRAGLRMLGLTLPLMLAVLVASLLASRALVEPLQQLRVATDRISRGDFDVELDIRSHDEVGQLADSFERMVAAIKFFRERSRPEEDEALEEELVE